MRCGTGWSPLTTGRRTSAAPSTAASRGKRRASIYDPGGTGQTINNQTVVLTDGTLVTYFTRFAGAGATATLAVIRSTDKGVTWSAAFDVSDVQSIGTDDPENGTPVRDGAQPRRDRGGSGGSLVAVWQDARFSGGVRDGVALSRSIDGGLTWSAPVQVNRDASVARIHACRDDAQRRHHRCLLLRLPQQHAAIPRRCRPTTGSRARATASRGAKAASRGRSISAPRRSPEACSSVTIRRCQRRCRVHAVLHRGERRRHGQPNRRLCVARGVGGRRAATAAAGARPAHGIESPTLPDGIAAARHAGACAPTADSVARTMARRVPGDCRPEPILPSTAAVLERRLARGIDPRAPAVQLTFRPSPRLISHSFHPHGQWTHLTTARLAAVSRPTWSATAG